MLLLCIANDWYDIGAGPPKGPAPESFGVPRLMPKNTGHGAARKPVTVTTWIKGPTTLGVFAHARANGGAFGKAAQ